MAAYRPKAYVGAPVAREAVKATTSTGMFVCFHDCIVVRGGAGMEP